MTDIGAASRNIAGVLAALSCFLAGPVRDAAAREDKIVEIGVLAFRGADKALQDWGPTATYLSAAVPGYAFRIAPLPLKALRQATAESRIDFLLTNSGNYVELEAGYGVSRIATLKRPSRKRTRSVFGAVIFVRADRTDLRGISDLEGKSFAAVARQAFGGFQMAWKVFKDRKIDPFSDLSRIAFLGFPQDKIVFAVGKGAVDAGTVRTGVLETMAREGKIELDRFRVLNSRSVPGFPYALSTALYPEWPFAKLRGTPAALSEKVAIALLRMPADSAAARAGAYSGWTVPLDYGPIHDLFRDLRVGPYARGRISLYEIIEAYWEWFVFAIIVLALVALHGVRTEYLVARRTRELSATNAELERQNAERRRAEERARQHEAELAHVSRVSLIGEMASGLAHELNQPLSAIGSYARGCVRRIAAGDVRAEELREALENVVDQAGRAGRIIGRIRGFIRKDEPRRDRVDLNAAVREAAALLAEDARRRGISIQLELARPLPPIEADLIEIEQIILNLSRNAMDAMEGRPDRILRIATSMDAAGDVNVAVTDTGHGINSAALAQVWEPFFTTKPSGLGLGLSICQSIVEAHGGRIRLTSASDQGATVSFTIPASADQE